MNKIKPSDKLLINFSTLSLWSKSRIDEAINCYFHRNTYDTDQMADGRAYHKKWQEEIETKKELHIGKSLIKFNNPVCEVKITANFNKYVDLHGTIDCIDIPKDDGDCYKIFEWKTGITGISDYGGTMQIPVYLLLCELVGLPVEEANLYHLNQYNNKGQFLKIWNNEEKILSARNWIDTLSNEVYDYFITHNIPFDK